MIEVYKNLFIGDQQDYDNNVKQLTGWKVIHACKEPYHRGLLGYTTVGAPKDHPEYLLAERPRALYLNLVDTPNPEYISSIIIDKALEYITESINGGFKVLVHCNQGNSRSATIGLMWLSNTKRYEHLNFKDAEVEFRKIYPKYKPAYGMREYASLRWDELKVRKIK